jgi:hypothetical protein
MLTKLEADVRAALGRQVLTPGDYIHSEGETDPRNLTPLLSQAHEAKTSSMQIRANGAHPSLRANVGHLLGKMTGGSEDQRPGQLSRSVGKDARATYYDTMTAARSDVDCHVAAACSYQQTKVRESRNEFAVEACALAHRYDDFEVVEPVLQMIAVADVVAEGLYFDLVG